MTVEYLDSKRVQGSSTAPNTSVDEDFTVDQSTLEARWDNYGTTDTSSASYTAPVASTDSIDFQFNSNAWNACSRDITSATFLNEALSETAWVLRFKVVFTALDGSSGNAYWTDCRLGLWSFNATDSSGDYRNGNAGNYIAFEPYTKDSGDGSGMGFGWSDNGSRDANAVDIGNADTYYFEIIRDGATLKGNCWTGSYDGTSVMGGQSTKDLGSDFAQSGTGGVLKYFGIFGYNRGTANNDGKVTGRLEQIEIYNGKTSTTQDDKSTLVTASSELYTEAVTGSSIDLSATENNGRMGVMFDGITPANIDFVKVHLRKIGTHTDSNVISCNVRNISTGNIDATATLTAGDLTGGTTVTEYTFTFSSPVSIGADTQRLLIEYPYGDATDYLGLTRAGAHDDVDWTIYDGTGNNYTEYTSYSMSGTFGLNASSDLQENTIFNQTDTYQQYWLQDGVWQPTTPPISDNFDSSPNGWTFSASSTITGGYLNATGGSNNYKAFTIGTDIKCVLDLDWSVGSSPNSPFVILSSDTSGYGNPASGHKKIQLFFANGDTMYVQSRNNSGSGNVESTGTVTSVPTADTIKYYRFRFNATDKLVEFIRYPTDADRRNGTNAEATISGLNNDNWNAPFLSGTADLAYISVGGYSSGANKLYDMKLWLGVDSI